MNQIEKRISLPSIEELKSELQVITQLARQGASPKEIDTYWENRIRLKMFVLQVHEPSVFNTIKFYRVRNNVSINENINSIKTFSYPPKEFAHTGRCNLNGNAVFYTTIGKNTAILEARSNKDDILYFTEWAITSKEQITVCNFLFDNAGAEKPWEILALKHKQELFNEIRNKRTEDFEHLMLIYNFWCEQFAIEESPYILTSYLSYKLLYEMQGVSAISYPSKQQKLIGLNTAFHPSVIDSCFSLKKAYKYQLTSANLDSGVFTMNILERGEVVNDKIIWSDEINETDEDYWKDLNPELFKNSR